MCDTNIKQYILSNPNLVLFTYLDGHHCDTESSEDKTAPHRLPFNYTVSSAVQAGWPIWTLRVLALTTISLCRNEQQGGAT